MLVTSVLEKKELVLLLVKFVGMALKKELKNAIILLHLVVLKTAK